MNENQNARLAGKRVLKSSWVTGQNISVDGGATAGWRDDAESDRIVALYS